MSRRSLLLASVCVALLFSLTACWNDNSPSNLYVASAYPGVSGYLPTGWGWKPNTKVEISIWHEPDQSGGVSTQWKKVLVVDVDPNSLFGFNPSPQVYSVARNICGNPVQGQTVLFMGKNLNTGKIVMREAPADLYYTFKACGTNG
jgi:hypothetical protein